MQTDNIIVDLEIGEERKNNEIEDAILIETFRNKYEIELDYKIIYTNGSVQKNKKSTRVGIVIDESETHFGININNKYSIYCGNIDY